MCLCTIKPDFICSSFKLDRTVAGSSRGLAQICVYIHVCYIYVCVCVFLFLHAHAHTHTHTHPPKGENGIYYMFRKTQKTLQTHILTSLDGSKLPCKQSCLQRQMFHLES